MAVFSKAFAGDKPVKRLYRGPNLLWNSFPTEPHMTNQFLWVDPSELGQSYGTRVSSLSDKTVNGHDFTQGTVGRQPFFTSNAINGMPAMQFDGIDDSLSTASGPNPGDEYTISVVVKPTSLRHSSYTAQYGNTIFAPSSKYAAWFGISAGTLDGPGKIRHWPYTANASGHIISDGDTIEVDEVAVITVEATRGGTAKAYINGIEVGSYSASTQVFAGYLTIGDLRNNRNICWHGYIGELVMYDKVLTPEERTQTEQYLSGKWMQEAIEPPLQNELLIAVADCADIANFGGTIGDKLLLTFEDTVELTGTVDDLVAEFGTALQVPASATAVDGRIENGNTVVLEAVDTFNSRRDFTNEVVTNVLGVAYAVVQDVPITQSTIVATGGTVYDDGVYKYHEFITSGDFVVSAINGTGDIEYLVVAGGGAGSRAGTSIGTGAGGAGGLLSGTQTVTVGTYPIVVGGGGSALVDTNGDAGGDGSDSTFDALVAIGGGGGIGYMNGTGAGGSGGGAPTGVTNTADEPSAGGSPVVGQGHAGGSTPGLGGGEPGAGGGGAGSAGQAAAADKAGDGGAGLDIWGHALAGGGSGGTGNGSGNAGGAVSHGGGAGAVGVGAGQSGVVNTGGGGGGASADSNIGGYGGSGIVIVRYPL